MLPAAVFDGDGAALNGVCLVDWGRGDKPVAARGLSMPLLFNSEGAGVAAAAVLLGGGPVQPAQAP